MNRKHSFFRKTHKLLFSVVALLLIICMLPTTAFATDDGSELTMGITWGNADGHSGQAYGSGGTEWADMTRDPDGNPRKAHAFMGYRVYVIDGNGTLQSKVVDLRYSDIPNSSITKYETQICGNTDSNNYGHTYISRTYNQNDVTDLDSNGNLIVYSAAYYGYNSNTGTYTVGGGTYTLGSNFAAWMQVKDNTGTKNAQKLMGYAFGVKTDGTYYADEYLKHSDYRLIVEPLMYSDVWTPYEWITVETANINEYYIKHFIKIYHGEAYDMCCNKSKSDGGTGITRDEYISWCISNGKYYAQSMAINYGKPAALDSITSATLNLSYYLIQASNKSNQKEVIEDLGYGTTGYNNLTDKQKVEVYNKMVELGYPLVYGNIYVTSTKEGIVYTNPKKITYKFNGVDTTLYADWNLAYANDPTHWANTNAQHATYGKHYVAAYTGDIVYGTYTNIKTYLSTLTNLSGTTCNDWGALGGVCKDYQNPLGDGFCLATSETIGSKTYGAGTNGMHIYHMDEIGGGKPIHTKDPETPDPSKPHPAEEPKEEKQNTGECTIIKVYGNIYKDGSNYYHIEDVTTEVRTGTTDSIVIEQESPYELIEWRVAKKSLTDFSATKWKSISSTNTLDNNTDSYFTSYVTKTPSDTGFTTTGDNPYKMENGTVLYLLYLKPLTYLETSDKPIPDTPDPNDTYPENPSSDKNNQDNPDKKGSFNIIKVYATLDEYNGKVISTNTYPQQSTTPFIKIESTPESTTWTLAQWKVTDKFNSDITANDWCGEATTETQLQSFYLNHFYDISTTSTNTSKFGTVYETGTTPCTKYISNGTTLYLLFTQTNGTF